MSTSKRGGPGVGRHTQPKANPTSWKAGESASHDARQGRPCAPWPPVIWPVQVVGCVPGWPPRGGARMAATLSQWETHCSWFSVYTEL